MRVKDWKALFNEFPDDLQFVEMIADFSPGVEVQKVTTLDGVLQLHIGR